MSEPGQEIIYYLDHMVAQPGRAKELLRFYMSDYVPQAKRRGLTLVHRWVTPPLWLKEQSNELFVIWSVQGAQAWWDATRQRRADPSFLGFWEEAQPMIVDRRRLFLSEVDDVNSLNDV
jgi:hypothetical protein